MKRRIIISFLIFSILLTSGCGQTQTSRLRYYPRYRMVEHTGHPYAALNYIKNFSQSDNTAVPADPLLVILQKYSPDAYYLVQRLGSMPDTIKIGGQIISVSGGPGRRIHTDADGRRTEQLLTGKGFRMWIDSNKPFFNQVDDISTAVHELCHTYTSKYANYAFSKNIQNANLLKYKDTVKNRYFYIHFDAFYRNRNTTLLALQRYIHTARYRAAFPARKIVPMIPEGKRTFRWKTYLLSRHSADTTGISGLLDEYNAYYWSNKVTYDLYNYYRNEQPQTAKIWGNWIEKIAAYYFSYVEFRYWILMYLQYAKKHVPKIFQSLLKDKHLRVAFTRIDDDFSELIHRIFHRMLVELPQYLKKIGMKVFVNMNGITYFREKRILTIHYQIDNVTKGLFSYYYLPLQEELLKPEMMDIANEFRTTPFREFPLLRIPEALKKK